MADGDERASRALLHVGMERRAYSAEFEVKAAPDGTGGTRYSLRGYATVYGKQYRMHDKHGEYKEHVKAGGGKKTLSENPDVVFVVNHEGIPMARTKSGSLLLSEDSTGLEANAPKLNGERQLIREVVAAVEDGDLDEMSFAFKTTRQQWNDDYTEREISEYSLHRGDVSVVTFGANPHTSIARRAEDFDHLDEDEARAILARLQRRFTAPPEPPAAAMPLRLAMALAAAQG